MLLRRVIAGVAIYSKEKPEKVIRGFGIKEFDDEGPLHRNSLRQAECCVGPICPQDPRAKNGRKPSIGFWMRFTLHLQKLQRRRSEYILCGDWNIAHKQIDIKNWRANQKNSGFLPEERAWMDDLFGPHKYVDAFRTINLEEHQYTWWSNRGRAWDKQCRVAA